MGEAKVIRDAFIKYDSISGTGYFCMIKPGKNKYITIIFVSFGADGLAAPRIEVLDTKGTWHILIAFYLASANSYSPNIPEGGIPLKICYDKDSSYRVARDKVMLRLNNSLGSASVGATISWEEWEEGR